MPIIPLSPFNSELLREIKLIFQVRIVLNLPSHRQTLPFTITFTNKNFHLRRDINPRAQLGIIELGMSSHKLPLLRIYMQH
jgi:hypothetical protein